MNELKSVLKRLNEEVKLSSEKVELGAVQDLESAAKRVSNIRQGGYEFNKEAVLWVNEMKPLLKIKQEMDDFISGNESFVKKAEDELKKAFNELSNQANELGIAPNKLPVYKAYQTALNELDEYRKFFNAGVNAVKSVKL